MARKKYIYEVRCTIPMQITTDFREWLADHLDDMLSLPYFTGGQIVEGELLDRPEMHLFVVRYELKSKQDLNVYLEKAAPQMRSKLPEDFAGRVEYARALLTEPVST